jgi:hypothetical protein
VKECPVILPPVLQVVERNGCFAKVLGYGDSGNTILVTAKT